MKVAIIHDSLVEFGGSERILDIFLELFPESHIYTAIAGDQFLNRHLRDVSKNRIHSSWLRYFPVGHHTSLIQAVAPLVWRSFDLTGYDLVISHGHHLMANLVNVSAGTHISYIPSPPKNIVGIHPPSPLQRIFPYDRYMLPIYRKSLVSIPHIIVNSKHTQAVLQKYFGVHSSVIYPPVGLPPHPHGKSDGKYFITVSRIEPNKHLEIAVIAATHLNVPLKIIGVSETPWYEHKLKSLAGPTVKFLGYQTDRSIDQLYKHATAFIFSSKNEDFGIAPLEASAHGVPVIAYYGGGAKETVIEGKTGLFFRSHTPQTLAEEMKRIRAMHFDPEALRAHAGQFNEKRFKTEFMRYVRSAMKATSVARSGSNG